MKASGMKLPGWMDSLPKPSKSHKKQKFMVPERDSLLSDPKHQRQNYIRTAQKIKLQKLQKMKNRKKKTILNRNNNNNNNDDGGDVDEHDGERSTKNKKRKFKEISLSEIGEEDD
jgi:hypothetical protein